MHELDRIRHALADVAERGEAAVLATVVHIDGSVYRGVGARMLVRADGSTVGAVSGGCLEADIVARAPEVIAAGRRELVRYDTRASDDAVLGLGLGCQGVVDVQLEPLSGAALAEALEGLGVQREREAVRLAVCGGGNDAIPLVRLATLLGWRVVVFDHRPSFASATRFPEAERVVRHDASREPDGFARHEAMAGATGAVVMAHAATHDRAYLRALLGMRSLRYVGVLGPRRRTLELLHDAAGVAPGEIPPQVYAPVGLDLGAETPEEIALSIVSEMAAVLAGRSAQSLRDHAGPIHPNRISAP